MSKLLKTILILLVCMLSAIFVFSQNNYYTQLSKYKLITDSLFNSKKFADTYSVFTKDSTLVDTFICNKKQKILRIVFNKELQEMPFRDSLLNSMCQLFADANIKPYKNYKLKFYSNNDELKTLVPNYYRENKKQDKSRMFKTFYRKTPPIVTNTSKPYKNKPVLYNKGIALWHSHGWYYEYKLNRWEWQRARLFKTVEDLLPMTFTVNFLLPMLENAGASVFLPRERSIQTHEIIVDNDDADDINNACFVTNIKLKTIPSGFAKGNTPYTSENPFSLGTSIYFKNKSSDNQQVRYIPNIPETGEYPVYVSYKTMKKSCESVNYEVHHTGGITKFKVNQQMGSGTWVYLGTFNFCKGKNADIGQVIIRNNKCKNNKLISSDAVRFGGGMGNISRNGQISERPRYQEATRYYLQYSGFPDSIVWKLTDDENDYKDDLHAHGEWVNYLGGYYYKKRKKRKIKGLGIPIDLSLAFHTDAGTAQGDSIIGTLAIYNTQKDKGLLPNKISKTISRDLCDIVQTQIVNDLQQKYTTKWNRRGLWNRRYSEAYRPNTPTMLLELLSHQNFNDMQFAHQPTFQFDVSRAVYKGILKFLSSVQQTKYVVQPLPITHFTTKIDSNNIVLNWQVQNDPIEPTATPKYYIVYTRKNDGGYDNGTLVNTTNYKLKNVQKDIIYSFKVSAVNSGGESFASEELSACVSSQNKAKVLIINAFDRLGGADYFNEKNLGGYLDTDEGVPYGYNFYTVGSQYDFNKNSKWIDDDAPGFGASHANRETQIELGNTFNFSFTHGKAIKNAGYSFASVSDEAVELQNNLLNNYFAVDIIAGEEKTTYMPHNDSVKHYELFTKNMISALSQFTKNGGNIFISGAYIGSDAMQNKQDSLVQNILKYKVRTSNASKKGEFRFMNNLLNLENKRFEFNTKYNKKTYRAECVDAIEPAKNDSAKTFIRYTENNMSAGVVFKDKYRVVAIGFPFETIVNTQQQNMLMKEILSFFE